jgi:hypothetical protein
MNADGDLVSLQSIKPIICRDSFGLTSFVSPIVKEIFRTKNKTLTDGKSNLFRSKRESGNSYLKNIRDFIRIGFNKCWLFSLSKPNCH